MTFKLLRKVSAVFGHGLRILYFVACVMLAFAWLSVCFEVTMRYWFGRPQIWVVESVSYSLLFMTFLSTGWVLHKEGHVKMDWLLNRLSSRHQSLLNTITSIVAAVVWLAITWYTAQLTWVTHLSGAHVVSALNPPKAPILAIIPVGSFLLFIQLLRQAYGYLASYRASRD